MAALDAQRFLEQGDLATAAGGPGRFQAIISVFVGSFDSAGWFHPGESPTPAVERRSVMARVCQVTGKPDGGQQCFPRQQVADPAPAAKFRSGSTDHGKRRTREDFEIGRQRQAKTTPEKPRDDQVRSQGTLTQRKSCAEMARVASWSNGARLNSLSTARARARQGFAFARPPRLQSADQPVTAGACIASSATTKRSPSAAAASGAWRRFICWSTA